MDSIQHTQSNLNSDLFHRVVYFSILELFGVSLVLPFK